MIRPIAWMSALLAALALADKQERGFRNHWATQTQGFYLTVPRKSQKKRRLEARRTNQVPQR